MTNKTICTAVSLLVVLFALCNVAKADPVTYLFNMNTSTLKGSSGYLDMQFGAPGGISGGGSIAYNTTAEATVSGFTTDGTLVSENPYTTVNPLGGTDAYGHITGTLPGNVVFSDIGDGLTNEYSQPMVYGSELSFYLTLSGQGVTTQICPVTGGTSCSLPGFILDFFTASGEYQFTNDPYNLTGDQWVIGGVNLNQDTSTTPFLNPAAGGGPSDLTITQVAATPEPSGLVLVSTGLAGVGTWFFVTKRGLALSGHSAS